MNQLRSIIERIQRFDFALSAMNNKPDHCWLQENAYRVAFVFMRDHALTLKTLMVELSRLRRERAALPTLARSSRSLRKENAQLLELLDAAVDDYTEAADELRALRKENSALAANRNWHAAHNDGLRSRVDWLEWNLRFERGIRSSEDTVTSQHGSIEHG